MNTGCEHSIYIAYTIVNKPLIPNLATPAWQNEKNRVKWKNRFWKLIRNNSVAK